MTLEELKAIGEAPEWMDEPGYITISKGYLLPDETPKQMYQRVARTAAKYSKDPEYWEAKYLDIMLKNWLCPASPVLSNFGTERGLPISCNSIHVGDSVDSIYSKLHEFALLSKHGAGVGIYMGDIRGTNAKVNGNGVSSGVIPWIKNYDSATVSVKQGKTRGAASAIYLPIDHPDIEEFLDLRRQTGDVNRRSQNVNHGVCISDKWMQEMTAGDQHKREIWKKVLKTRFETGEPYLFFTDSVNRQNPECYSDKGLSVKTSNICFSGDTMLYTKDGYRRLRDLWVLGDQLEYSDFMEKKSFPHLSIVNSMGVAKSTPIYRTSEAAEVYAVTLNTGHTFKTTADHDFILADGTRRKLRELDIGAELKRSTVEVFGSYSNEEYALLAGMVIGDGSISIERKSDQMAAHIRLWNEDIEDCGYILQESLKKLAAKYNNSNGGNLGDFEFKPKYLDNFNFVRAEVTSRVLGRMLRDDGLHPGNKHKVPDSLWSGEKGTVAAFIRGLMSADGSVQVKDTAKYKSIEIRIGQTSRELLEQVHLLLSQFGIFSKIRSMRKSDTQLMNDGKGGLKEYRRQAMFELIISGRKACEKYMAEIGFIQDKKNAKAIKWLDEHKGSNNSHIEQKVFIMDIEFAGIEETFCLTEPESNEVTVHGVHTGQCTEIFLHTDEDHSFVCCLSSMNLVRWDEWKDTDAVETSIRFLDAVLEEYITRGRDYKGLSASIRSAIKGRALGLGVLGYHSLLQMKMYPFDSFEAMMLNNQIFKTMREKAEASTRQLAEELGEPEWCKGHGRRNTHLLAIAPTASNSTIAGGHSPGIEPVPANMYSQKSAKGTFIRKNPLTVKLLQEKGKDLPEVWKSINANDGSVQHLKFLSDEEKAVFLTAREINQFALIKQAEQRQKYIDQGQSLNLFFASNTSAQYLHDVHVQAWKGGMIKSLYYLRSEGVLKGDMASRSKEECAACEG
jgi:ribonucleoside-diphosphate reductase alpha chain